MACSNGASSFNQPLSSWDVSSVADEMSDMFYDASSFQQNLGNWYVVPALLYGICLGRRHRTANALEFSLTGTPPSGASIHQDTGAFSWTPSESQDGTHTITIQRTARVQPIPRQSL